MRIKLKFVSAFLILIILLGALMVSGLGMLTGAAGKDFMGTILIGMLFLIPMAIPAVSAIFPGTASSWVKVLPSYGVVQGIVGVITYHKGWTEMAPLLGLIMVWVLILLGCGFFILKRKVETL